MVGNSQLRSKDGAIGALYHHWTGAISLSSIKHFRYIMFMQSSRDSSIWRSLAVAFGDGVAFGVGVKLAQGVQRPAAGAPPAPVQPAVDWSRIDQIEQRIASIEQAPPPDLPASMAS